VTRSAVRELRKEPADLDSMDPLGLHWPGSQRLSIQKPGESLGLALMVEDTRRLGRMAMELVQEEGMPSQRVEEEALVLNRYA
jgi:hypothetical protein